MIIVRFVAFPWIENGNIVEYLAQNPNADRVKLVRVAHVFHILALTRVNRCSMLHAV